MTAPDEDIEDLRTAAADWFVRVHSDGATGEDWLALEAWLAQSPQRRAVFEEVELLWSELDSHAGSLRGSPTAALSRSVVSPIKFTLRARGRPRLAAWAAIAAAVVVAAGIWLWRDRGPPEQVFTTGKGETLTLALADGSSANLNSDTELVARVSRTSRNLVLERGEAFFDVAKDRAHPFRVTAGDQKITVVGTQFDVLRSRGEVSVTVSRGIVEVSNLAGGHGAATRLTVGDRLRHEEGASGSELSKARLDEVLAWRRGYLVYQDRPLSEVAADIDRFVPVPIETDPSVANLMFSGALKLGDETSLLNALQAFLPVEAVRRPGRILLRSRSSHD